MRSMRAAYARVLSVFVLIAVCAVFFSVASVSSAQRERDYWRSRSGGVGGTLSSYTCVSMPPAFIQAGMEMETHE